MGSIAPADVFTSYKGFDHVQWYVGNAKQAAAFYVLRMGFERIAYRGLETGSRVTTSHVVRNGDITFVLTSPLHSATTENVVLTKEDRALLSQIHTHLEAHGDAVCDVAFEVEDADGVFEAAIARGAQASHPPKMEKDQFGTVRYAQVKTFGDTTHTLIQRSGYTGAFLPGFRAISERDPTSKYLPEIRLGSIDHCVGKCPGCTIPNAFVPSTYANLGNQDWNGMEATAKYYENTLGFHRFWSIDDKDICTDVSALRSIVMASPDEKIKVPINEPAEGNKKSQVEEFVEFYNAPGIQHIALRTDDILTTIRALRERGIEFITIPPAYYEQMAKRLATTDLVVHEDFAEIQKLGLLIDFDEGGYLLQLFTKPLMDRPTVFLEIIQRNNFAGFGAGNFRALFAAMEKDQEERGNLSKQAS